MFKKLKEWLFSRSVQQIFNVVIDKGIYTHQYNEFSSNLMCCALSIASSKGLITKAENKKAKVEIRKYLDDESGFLEDFKKTRAF